MNTSDGPSLSADISSPHTLPEPATRLVPVVCFVVIVLAFGAGRLLDRVWDAPEAVAGSMTALASFAPLIAAVVISGLLLGRAGLRELRARLLRWRIAPGWYALGLLAPLAIYGSLLVAWILVGGPQPTFDADTLMMIPVIVVAGLLFALAEEVGWRGWLLRALQSRVSALGAALAVGLVWLGWHTPLHHVPDHPLSEIALAAYAPLLLAVAVVFAAIYNATDGSVPAVAVTHVGFNLAVGTTVLALPEGATAFVGLCAAVTVVIAVVVAVVSRGGLAVPPGATTG